ncbi:MAG: AAA family ATPase, partial [Thermoplasmata archaeon]
MTDVKFNITIEDTIMLHLQHFSRFQDEFEAPYDITQPGIAEAIGIRRSHVSHVMKNLREKDFVSERTAHVKDTVRKRKIYLLTQAGISYALKLRESLEQKEVNLVEKSGAVRSITLSEINSKLNTRLSIRELITLITPEGSIEAKQVIDFDKKPQKPIPKDVSAIKSVNFIDSMAHPVRFLGRADELAKLNQLIDNKLPRVMVIIGIPGVGKTTLVSKILNDYVQESSSNIFWYQLHEWDSLRGTLRELAEFLSQLGRKKLQFYLDNESNLELPEIMKILETDLVDLNVILTFDDVQKINDDLKPLFSMLVELVGLEKLENTNIILLTRTKLDFYDRKKVAIKNLVAELELDGLDSEASRQLLDIDEIADLEFKKIYNLTEGHPLTLELIHNHLSSKPSESRSEVDLAELFKSHHDLQKYFREEIYVNLSTIEKKLFEMISVHRYPIPAEAFFIDPEINYECIDSLLDRSLLHETITGYDAHELIKEFFNHRLTTSQRAKYHEDAASYYKAEFEKTGGLKGTDVKEEVNAIIEAQYHYICAGNYNDAGTIAI